MDMRPCRIGCRIRDWRPSDVVMECYSTIRIQCGKGKLLAGIRDTYFIENLIWWVGRTQTPWAAAACLA